MRTYSRDFILLNESYWNFSVVDDELHSISTCDETKPHQVTDQAIHLVTQPVFYNSSALIAIPSVSYSGTNVTAWLLQACRQQHMKDIKITHAVQQLLR